MVKILSQAGNSLADIYDVEGSIAGVEQLESRELPIVHEMGTTVFSERFSTRIVRSTSGAVSQSSTFNLLTATEDLPDALTRLLGVAFITDDATRVARLTLAQRSRDGTQDIPLWAWDETTSLSTRLNDDGATSDFTLLVGSGPMNMLPTFIAGQGQPDMVDGLNGFGATTAFGAGSVTVTGLYLIAFGEVTSAGISSRGLPIPSW